MKLSLTKVKVHRDMSEETNCFSATICLDGKVVGTVSNAGQGGPNFYHWSNAQVGKKIEDYAKSLPPIPHAESGTAYLLDMDIDLLVDDLLAKEEELKKIRRWCKKETVFRLKGDKPKTWQIIKAPFDAKVKTFLINKFGDKIDRIANEEI